MLKSYPLVKAALALDRLAVACVVGAVGHERLPERLAGRDEIRHDAECLESEQRSPTARRLGLRRTHGGASGGVGNYLGSCAGSSEGTTGSTERRVCRRRRSR